MDNAEKTDYGKLMNRALHSLFPGLKMKDIVMRFRYMGCRTVKDGICLCTHPIYYEHSIYSERTGVVHVGMNCLDRFGFPPEMIAEAKRNQELLQEIRKCEQKIRDLRSQLRSG